MIALVRRHPIAAIALALLSGALIALLIFLLLPTSVPDRVDSDPSAPAPTETPMPTPTTPSIAEGCDVATVTVSSAAELESALSDAQPGDTIALEPGEYSGNFVATVSGTPDSPIALCGSPTSVLNGGTTGDGYVFHLDGAQYWRLIGFSVTNGQKGVMADNTVGSLIDGLTVSHIGDEAIHLRAFSTDNTVSNNTISDTGNRKQKFGEGIYIGTAESNWCDISDCQPDKSDRNVVEGNTISATTAESVDIKEGTTGGVLRNNSFDGSSLTEGDSWVDVKGNGWLIEGNSGVNSPLDGFQTHEILDGWGTDNTFRGNSATVNGSGFGFSLTPVRDNVVSCTNSVSAAGEGFSNVNCSG